VARILASTSDCRIVHGSHPGTPRKILDTRPKLGAGHARESQLANHPQDRRYVRRSMHVRQRHSKITAENARPPRRTGIRAIGMVAKPCVSASLLQFRSSVSFQRMRTLHIPSTPDNGRGARPGKTPQLFRLKQNRIATDRQR